MELSSFGSGRGIRRHGRHDIFQAVGPFAADADRMPVHHHHIQPPLAALCPTMPAADLIREQRHLHRVMLTIRRQVAPRPHTAHGLTIQSQQRGVAITHAERLEAGGVGRQREVFERPTKVKAAVIRASPQVPVLDIAGHHVRESLVIGLHALDRRPVFALLRVLPTIGVQITGVPAVGIVVVAILGVLRGGEAELAQVGEALRLPGPLPHPAEDREQEGREERHDGDDDQQFDQRESTGMFTQFGPILVTALHGSTVTFSAHPRAWFPIPRPMNYRAKGECPNVFSSCSACLPAALAALTYRISF